MPKAKTENEEMDAETAISKESETALVLAMDTKVETLIKEFETMKTKMTALEDELKNRTVETSALVRDLSRENKKTYGGKQITQVN